MRPLRYLAPVALMGLLALLAGCGNGSSSSADDPTSPTTGTAPSGALEVRPVYARYAEGVPLGGPQLGPTVPANLLTAMKHYDCSSKPTELSGMLMLCDSAQTVFLLKDPIIQGDVQSAEARQIGHGKLWFVKLAFDSQATSTLAQATKSMAGTELAFVLRDSVLTAPIIDSSMKDGHVGITGTYDEQQAKKLAHQLSSQ